MCRENELLNKSINQNMCSNVLTCKDFLLNPFPHCGGGPCICPFLFQFVYKSINISAGHDKSKIQFDAIIACGQSDNRPSREGSPNHLFMDE